MRHGEGSERSFHPPPPGLPGDHVKELDGLRGVAILLVVIHHFIDGPGWIGVEVFFAISGFLITGICLDHRGPGFLCAFFARRALRIMPLYLVVTAIAAVFVRTTGAWPAHLASVLTFTTNIVISGAHGWDDFPGPFRHFWSLAVEEQFYLVWPLILSRVSLRSARNIALACFPMALGARVWLIEGSGNLLAAYVTSVARMDALAAGAMCAIYVRDPTLFRLPRHFNRIADASGGPWAAAVVLGLWLVWYTDGSSGRGLGSGMEMFGFSMIAVACGLLVLLTLLASEDTALRAALRGSAIRSIGKYSYSMYLIHFPLLVATRTAGLRPHGAMQSAGLLSIGFAVSYGLSALSWRLVEEPVLRLKSRFPYGTTARGLLELKQEVIGQRQRTYEAPRQT